MPQAVALWVGTALQAAGASLLTAQVAGVAAYAATAVAVSAGLSEISAKLAAKAADDGGFVSRDVVVSAGKVPQTIVYGETWCGGALLYCNSRHDPGTKDNFTFYRHIAHTAHEVDSITDLMFDDDVVLDSTDIDWAAGHITAGKYALTKAGVYAVDVAKTLGTGTETQSPMLSAAFPVDYPGSGIYTTPGWSTTTVSFRYFSKTAKDAEGLFYSGPPSRQLARIRGHKCYDPRLDTTNGGSGSQRLATPSTWTWSNNPVLQATHYMMVYMNIPSARIDWGWIAQEATICSTDVSIPAPISAEPRFHGNGAISLANSHLDNLQAILSSCLGWISRPAGAFRINAASYKTPDVTLTKDDIIGDPQLKGGFGLDERYNSVTGIYVNPAAYAEEMDALPISDAAFVTRDGGYSLPTTISLPFCSTETLAQRLSYMHLAQSDRQKVFTIGVTWTGLAVTIGTRCSITFDKFGWSAKPFRCIGWKRGDSSPFVLVLREDDSAVWADPAVGAYSVRDADGIVTTGTVEIPSPTAGGSAGEITVQNANFESGDFYWSRDTSDWTIPIDVSNAHQGSYVAKRIFSATADSSLTNYITFPAKPGANVSFGGYVKTSGTPGGSWGFRVQFLNQAKSLLSTVNLTETSPSTTWHILKGPAVAPASTHFVVFGAVTYGMSAGTVFFDDTFMLVNSGSTIGVDFGDGSGGIVDHIPPVQNVLGSGYYDNETLTLDAYQAFGTGTVALAPGTAYIGKQSVYCVGTTGSGAEWGVRLVPRVATLPNLYIPPGRRWLIGVAIYPSGHIANTACFYASYSTNGTLTTARNSLPVNTGTDTGFKEVWLEIDGTSDSIIWTSLALFIHNAGALGGTPYMYLDGIMMIDATDQPWLTVTNPPTTLVPASGANPRPPETERLRYYRGKTANETISSDAVLNNDGELFGWTLDAGSLYEFEGVIKFNSGATPDFATVFSFSSAPTSAIGWVEQVNASGTQGFYWDVTTLKQWEGGAASQALWFKIAIITNGATTVNFQWSQWSSTASNTTVEKGSFGVFSKIPPD